MPNLPEDPVSNVANSTPDSTDKPETEENKDQKKQDDVEPIADNNQNENTSGKGFTELTKELLDDMLNVKKDNDTEDEDEEVNNAGVPPDTEDPQDTDTNTMNCADAAGKTTESTQKPDAPTPNPAEDLDVTQGPSMGA